MYVSVCLSIFLSLTHAHTSASSQIAAYLPACLPDQEAKVFAGKHFHPGPIFVGKQPTSVRFVCNIVCKDQKAGTGRAKTNKRRPKSCLGGVFYFKLSCFCHERNGMP